MLIGFALGVIATAWLFEPIDLGHTSGLRYTLKRQNPNTTRFYIIGTSNIGEASIFEEWLGVSVTCATEETAQALQEKVHKFLKEELGKNP
jgi:hypothetical protein